MKIELNWLSNDEGNLRWVRREIEDTSVPCKGDLLWIYLPDPFDSSRRTSDTRLELRVDQILREYLHDESCVVRLSCSEVSRENYPYPNRRPW